MNPIGINFMPSDENQAMGPHRGALEGQGGSDLADAFKILSLRLPQVLGARSLAPQRLLTSPGSSALPPAFDPNGELLKRLIATMLGGGAPSPYRDFFQNEPHTALPEPEPSPMLANPVPRFTPGNQPGGAVPDPGFPSGGPTTAAGPSAIPLNDRRPNRWV